MAFEVMKKHYRHEYVYKAVLTNKLLFKTHSLRTASVLFEFGVDKSKADIVVLNGTSTVYEIKSDRDNLDRLEGQVAAYLRAFARVNVVAGESHVDTIMSRVPSDVGVMLLTKQARISTLRRPVEDPSRIRPEIVFDSLQLCESRCVLEMLGTHVPDVPNTQAYASQRALFIKQDPTRIHHATLKVLKRTRSRLPLANILTTVPESLQAAAINTPMNQRSHARWIQALDTAVQAALTWT